MWVRFLPDAALPGAGDTSDDVDDMPNTGEYPGGYSGSGWAAGWWGGALATGAGGGGGGGASAARDAE